MYSFFRGTSCLSFLRELQRSISLKRTGSSRFLVSIEPKMRRLNTPTLPVCPYGKSTKMVISWTSRNPGRRYAVCADGGCEFWVWIDGEMCRSIEVIPGLLRRVNATKQQMDELQTVLTKLESKATKLKVKVKDMEHELARQKHIRK